MLGMSISAEELPPIPEQDSTIVQAEQSRAEESTIIEKPTRSRKSKEEKSLLDIPPETPGNIIVALTWG